jgi:hypothetical protein
VFQAEADCVLSVFLSMTDVSLGFADGALVNVSGGVSILNGGDERVPVDMAGGTITVTAENVGINNTDVNPVPVRSARSAQIVNKPAAVVNTGVAQAVVSDATLAGLRFRNASASAVVWLGGAGLTPETAAIELRPGDMWTETEAPGAAWYAVSDTNGADVRVQGVK